MSTGTLRVTGLLVVVGVMLLNTHCGVPLPDGHLLSDGAGDGDIREDGSGGPPETPAVEDGPQQGGVVDVGLGRLKGLSVVLDSGSGGFGPVPLTIDPNDPLDGTKPYEIVTGYGMQHPLWPTSVWASVELGDANATAVESTFHLRLWAADSNDPTVKSVDPLMQFGGLGDTLVAAGNLHFEDPNTGAPIWVWAYMIDQSMNQGMADDAAGLYLMNFDNSVIGSSYFYLMDGAAIPYDNDTRQVPQWRFVDRDYNAYGFEAIKVMPTQHTVTALWSAIPSPTPDPNGNYAVHYNLAGHDDVRPGGVYEIGAATNLTTKFPVPPDY